MINRNAARHLALVASVVLCLLVYIGYRYRFSSGGGDVRSPDITELAGGGAAERQTTSLMAINEEPAAKDAPVIRTAITTPSGASTPPAPASAARAGEGLNDISDLLNDLDRGDAAPPARASAAPVAPSGSIEESFQASASPSLRPPSAGSGQGITGLVPDNSAAAPRAGSSRPVSERPAGTTVTPPPDGGITPPPSEGEDEREQSTPIMPPPPGGAAPIAAGNGENIRPGGNAPIAAPPAASAAMTGGGAALSSPPARGAAIPPLPPPAAAPTPRPGAAAASDSLRVYIIRSGDTLSSIAARELGSISLADNIYLLNRDVISDPDRLLAGEKIRLPVRETLPRNGAFPAQAGSFDRPDGPTPSRTPPPLLPRPLEGRKVHRVNRGETLSSIAQYYYGASTEWRVLYEANRNLLANPNQLAVGMELIIPPHTAPGAR